MIGGRRRLGHATPDSTHDRKCGGSSRRSTPWCLGWRQRGAGQNPSSSPPTTHLLSGPPATKTPSLGRALPDPGRAPLHHWGWNNHSNHLVPLFVRGPDAQARLKRLANEKDPRRGRYMQDIEVFQLITEAWGIDTRR